MMATASRTTSSHAEEKKDLSVDGTIPAEGAVLEAEVLDDEGEVFKRGTGQADFRTLGWIRTAVILMKLCFATGVLTIPSALHVVGYGPGIILLVAWGAMSTCKSPGGKGAGARSHYLYVWSLTYTVSRLRIYHVLLPDEIPCCPYHR
jgi:hypothetical protein